MAIQTLQNAPQPLISPAALDARRAIALAMMKEGSNYSPIQSPWQGVARVADAIMGGYRSHKLDEQEMAARQAQGAATADAIRGSFGGGGSGTFPPAPSTSPTADAGASSSPASGGDPMSGYANAIASIESDGSGGYGALGPTTKTGDRAYGRYQVMGNNIPEWTQEALGQPMTQQQFLADPKAQDAVFNHRFGQYVKQYGNPQDAASAWFTGGPLSSGGNAADQLGTTGNAYVDKFKRALAQAPAAAAANDAMAAGNLPPTAPVPLPNPQVASLDPAIGMQPPPANAPIPPAPQMASAGAPPNPISGRGAVIQAMGGDPTLPASAPTPAPMPAQAGPSPSGAATVSAAMNAPSNLPVMAGGSADAINPAMAGAMGGGRGNMDPSAISSIVNAMSSPWATDGQQQMLGSVLSSRLTPHKLEMVPLGDGSTAEIDSVTGQQVGQIKGIKPPVAMGYDQRLVDPMTGNQIGGGNTNGQLPYRFMTQDEKQASGLPLDTPIQVGLDGKMVTGGVTVNTGAPETSYGDKMMGALGSSHEALVSGVPAAQEKLRDIHAMQAAFHAIQANGGTTGMGESEITKLQSLINTGANALGYDQPFDISNKEFLTTFNKQLAGAQAKNAVGARVTNFELKNFLSSNPGQDLSPQGNERLLGIQAQILQRNIDVGQALADATARDGYAGKKLNPVENEKIIRDYDEAHHIMDPLTGQDLTQDVKLKDQSQPSPASAAGTGRPRATNAQGQSVEWDGSNWVPAQ